MAQGSRPPSSPEVGVPGVPETYAGMKPGDVLLEVKGVRVETSDHYHLEMMRYPRGFHVPVKVLREGREVLLSVTQSGSRHLPEPRSTKLPRVLSGSALEKAGVRSGDTILAVDGHPVFTDCQMLERIRDLGGREVLLLTRRQTGDSFRGPGFETTLRIPAKPTRRFPDDANLIEPVIGATVRDGPADGILREGDWILQINDERVESWQSVKRIVEAAIDPPRTLRFDIDREGDRKSFEITPTYGESGRGIIGVGIRPSRRFAVVTPDSYWAGTGLRSGDVLLSVEGREEELSIRTVLDHPFADGQESLRIKVEHLDGSRETLVLSPPIFQDADLGALGIEVVNGRLKPH